MPRNYKMGKGCAYCGETAENLVERHVLTEAEAEEGMRHFECPQCMRDGCPSCIPGGNHCLCPECEEGDL